MTVKRLIEQLEKMPEDAVVLLEKEDGKAKTYERLADVTEVTQYNHFEVCIRARGRENAY